MGFYEIGWFQYQNNKVELIEKLQTEKQTCLIPILEKQ